MQLMPIDLVRGEVELPSLSDVFQQFTAKLDDPHAVAEDFSDILSTDPALTLKLLKIVNSAYYGFSANITDVAHAITIVGLNDLRELVLAISVVEFFDGLPNELISMKSFWKHSVLTGLVSKELQFSPAIKSDQSLFTAGMLHDVGTLVFYNRLPELARTVLELYERHKQPRYLLEREVLGFDHAIIGGELIRHWGLPDFLIDVVASHHDPDKADIYREEAQLVNLADRLARTIEASGNPVAMVKEEYAAIPLGITDTHLQESIDKARDQLVSVLDAIKTD